MKIYTEEEANKAIWKIISSINVAKYPDFTNDLNLCYEMEMFIMNESSVEYLEILTRISCPWHATPIQRCRAFLETSMGQEVLIKK